MYKNSRMSSLQPKQNTIEEFLQRDSRLPQINILKPSGNSPNRELLSPLNKRIRKISSTTLFKDARKINGETYLKGTPEQTLISIKSKIHGLEGSSSKILAIPIKKSKSDNRMQIKRVMEINIIKEDELSDLILRGIQDIDNSFGNVSRLQLLPEADIMMKKQSSTQQQLADILNQMKLQQ